MYGLVNSAVADLARELGGEAAWLAIREKVGLVESSFVGMTAYPDELTYQLVDAASVVLDLPIEQILHAFGRHWVQFTGREGWGPLLKAAGSSLPEVLNQLDALHARVRLLLPELRPPSFRVTELSEHTLRLHYYSERPGLAPMVCGLVEGLAELLGGTATVEILPTDDDEIGTNFLIGYT